MPETILKNLKENTRRQHERLETRLDLLNRVADIAEYRKLLERFYGFYAPIESVVAAKAASLDFDFAARLKTPLLRQDFEALGLTKAEIPNLPICADLPDVSTVAKFFGYLYVAEGSTLGGQIISRHFARKLQINDQNGAAFFRAYGEKTGEMWREFQAAMTNFSENNSNDDEIIETATETFEKLEKWLFRE